MKILSGVFKGLPLSYPLDQRFRPTQDKVKEALFSILNPYLQGAHILDLFSGTGAVGFEALSRGAESVTFIDEDTQFIFDNFKYLSSHNSACKNTIIISSDVNQFLRQTKKTFDIIFMDPPWEAPAKYAHKKSRSIASNQIFYDEEDDQPFLDMVPHGVRVPKNLRSRKKDHPKDLKRVASYYADALLAISAFDILKPNGLVVCEHKKSVTLSTVDSLTFTKNYTYGDACLSFFEKATT